MAAYILRNLDPELWRRFRVACVALGVSSRDVLLTLIREWTERQEAKR